MRQRAIVLRSSRQAVIRDDGRNARIGYKGADKPTDLFMIELFAWSSPSSEMELPADFIEYQSKSTRLQEFDAGIHAKLRTAFGAKWQLVPEERRNEILSERQRDWEMLRYYEASLANSGDLFSCLGLIYSYPEAFAAIGATKTLAASESLRALYERQQTLGSQDEKDAFWRDTRKRRQPIEVSADSLLEFADLLIRFAESHPDEFTAVPAGDPFTNLSAYLDVLHQHITESRGALS